MARSQPPTGASGQPDQPPTKITDRPPVVFLSAIVAAFVAGVSVYAFFQERVGQETVEWLKANPGQVSFIGAPVPVGGIILWANDLRPLPEGFELCDGQPATIAGATFRGTKPDLIDRFPKGAPKGRRRNEELAAGGSHNLQAHNHSIGTLKIDGDGGHAHSPRTVDDDHGPSGGESPGLAIGGNDNSERGPTIGSGEHGHELKGRAGLKDGIDGDGRDTSGANQPAYTEVFFVIRVK